MAKAQFHCAECGDLVTIVGRNRSDADRKAKWHEAEGHLCDECEAKRLAEENAVAAAQNADAGLPALSGSDKQVAWAESIRQSMLGHLERMAPMMRLMISAVHMESATQEQRSTIHDKIIELLNQYDGIERSLLAGDYQYVMIEAQHADRYDAFLDVMRRQTRASWWIDNRNQRPTRLIEAMADAIDAEMAERKPATEQEAEVIREAKTEALLKPAGEPASQHIAEISLVGDELRVAFPEKREDFRLLMRGIGFHWAERHWARRIGFMQGNPIDRMAETAHRILALGIMVRLHDDEARNKALSGEFEPEQTRWVVMTTGGAYDGWLKIVWPKSDDLYTPAKALLGARYKDGAIYVPPGSIVEVADFANKYGFAMSQTPTRMLAEHKTALASGAVVADLKTAPAPVIDTGSHAKLVADETVIADELKD